MTQEEFLDEIMEAIESEPESSYGYEETATGYRAKLRGIRARIWELIETYDEEREEE